MRLLVTGGAGFIGSAVVRESIRRGHDVLNLDALTYAACPESLAAVSNHPRYQFARIDIRSRNPLDYEIENFAPDAIVHLAAESHVDRSIDGPRDFIETNISGTFNLLEAALRYWQAAGYSKSFRFLHVSTDEVYGSLGPIGSFNEDTSYDPQSPYSASKAAADHLVSAWRATFGLPTIITNSSNNYGPFQFPEKLVPVTILNAITGRSIPIYGEGQNVRDWLFVEDHADALLLALEKGRVGRNYNIGSQNERTNLELVQSICAILDRVAPRGNGSYVEQIEFVRDRPGHDLRYSIDPSRIRDELGWKPSLKLEEGLERTIRWYLENRELWGAPGERIGHAEHGRARA